MGGAGGNVRDSADSNHHSSQNPSDKGCSTYSSSSRTMSSEDIPT